MSRQFQGSVVTIGNFDGVHLGHQRILAITLEQSRELGAKAVAFTFRPHPQSVLRPDRAPALLLEYDEKRAVLESLGIDEVIEQPFDIDFAKTTAESFFEKILIGRLGVRAIVVGYDFTFGKGRNGHLQVLEHLCEKAGVRLTVVPPQQRDQEIVSSSAIRLALQQGQVWEALKSMGRPFSYQGVVVKGDQRGRKIGFPTANLVLHQTVGGKMILPYGVYATRTWWNGSFHPSVTNLGVRPTFVVPESAEAVPLVYVETHLLDISPDLYGQKIRVEFVDRIRSEARFASVSELQAQISADILKTRQILG